MLGKVPYMGSIVLMTIDYLTFHTSFISITILNIEKGEGVSIGSNAISLKTKEKAFLMSVSTILHEIVDLVWFTLFYFYIYIYLVGKSPCGQHTNCTKQY